MRKLISLALCLLLALSLAGCGSKESSGRPGGSQPAGVSDVLQQGMAESDGEGTGGQQDGEGQSSPSQQPSSGAAPQTEIDIDLTSLSSTMVYSEVYNMMVSPDDYIGKTVKMQGPFAMYHDEAADVYYFACIIKDATACCAQGLEFVLAGDHTYPDDYPPLGEEIQVVGVFDTYTEGDSLYCTLRNAVLL